MIELLQHINALLDQTTSVIWALGWLAIAVSVDLLLVLTALAAWLDAKRRQVEHHIKLTESFTLKAYAIDRERKYTEVQAGVPEPNCPLRAR